LPIELSAIAAETQVVIAIGADRAPILEARGVLSALVTEMTAAAGVTCRQRTVLER
jgi:hypothetical protein